MEHPRVQLASSGRALRERKRSTDGSRTKIRARSSRPAFAEDVKNDNRWIWKRQPLQTLARHRRALIVRTNPDVRRRLGFYSAAGYRREDRSRGAQTRSPFCERTCLQTAMAKQMKRSTAAVPTAAYRLKIWSPSRGSKAGESDQSGR
jgi:hypothetical protein